MILQKKLLATKLRDKAMALNCLDLLEDADRCSPYHTLRKIYIDVLLPYLHPLSQMGVLYGGINSLGDPRSIFHSHLHVIALVLPKPIHTLEKMKRDDDLYTDAQKLNLHAAVKKAHYIINLELGSALKSALKTRHNTLKLPFNEAYRYLKKTFKSISNNLRNPLRTTILSSHSLDSLDTTQADKFSPSRYDRRRHWLVREPYEAIIVREPYHMMEKLMNKKTRDLLFKVLIQEYDAEEHNLYNIYRGINRTTDESFFPSLTAENTPSISFGTTLFAGFTGDLGATAFYLACSRSTCLAVALDKQEQFRDIMSGKNKVVIPPYNTIVGLVGGKGEIFHSRTKVPLTYYPYNIPQLLHTVNGAITAFYMVEEEKEEFVDHLKLFLDKRLKIIYDAHKEQEIKAQEEEFFFDDPFAELL